MATSYVHGEADQVHHNCRDSMDRPLAAGQRYRLSRPGSASKTVKIFEDELTCTMYLRVEGDDRNSSVQRVDECAVDCSFSLIIDDGQVDDTTLAAIDEILRRASASRQQLASAEESICNYLGCEVGDMSPASDAVCAAVRDGLGNAFDLAQLVNRK